MLDWIVTVLLRLRDYETNNFAEVGLPPLLQSTTTCKKTGLSMLASYFCMIGLTCYCLIISIKINECKNYEYNLNNKYGDTVSNFGNFFKYIISLKKLARMLG